MYDKSNHFYKINFTTDWLYILQLSLSLTHTSVETFLVVEQRKKYTGGLIHSLVLLNVFFLLRCLSNIFTGLVSAQIISWKHHMETLFNFKPQPLHMPKLNSVLSVHRSDSLERVSEGKKDQ